MKIFKIISRLDKKLLFEKECDSFKICIELAVKERVDLRGADLLWANLQDADLQNANLRGADLQKADLRGADLRGADLQNANLRGADLQNANLRGVDLRGADLQNANLRGADLQNANLRGVDLRGVDLDFSCFPFHCGSFNIKTDDRLVSQLLYHVCKLDISNCSGGVKESIECIKNMAISDLFCEYRDDIERIIK